MDARSWLYLLFAVVGIAAADALLLDITKRRPRGAALILAFAMMVLGGMIPKGNSRELYLLSGSIQFAGFIGVFIGIYGLFRKLPEPTKPDEHGANKSEPFI
jgi:hypothetical protein